jgi:uncharacterized protein (TIGR00299 family) protein
MRIGYLECFSGISGDMLLGALVDAGVPLSHLEGAAAALHVGARLEARKVMRGGLTATKVDVITGDAPLRADSPGHSHPHEHEHSHLHTHEDGVVHAHAHTHSHMHDHSHPHEHEENALHAGAASHVHVHEQGHSHEHADAAVVIPSHSHAHSHGHESHRSLSTILGILARAHLAEDVKGQASRAFQMLGEAEAAIHSIPVEKVHFHEVGAVDTIVDIVCAAAGAAWLGVDRWLASPLNVGSGTVECAHGTLPVPAPATLKLLGDAPVYSAGVAMERVTPTGATILRMLDVRYTALPAMRVANTGYGAGGRDTAGQANVLRLLVGEESTSETGTEPIAILETVIDDSTPQVLAYVSELLLAAGAWDVYRVPVQMKKGRTGMQITVLAKPESLPVLRDLLFRETTTIGLHWRVENKIALKREFAQVDTTWGPVRIKVARWPSGEVANATPEYEDCRKIAAERGVPLKMVLQEAARVYSQEQGTGTPQ